MNSLQAGERLDHYLIVSAVAKSGMATVFRCKDMRSGAQVALKIPHFEAECDPVFFDRFRREEQIGMELDHPNVMKVFPAGDRSRVYMVMEWVEGRLLREILNEEGKLSADRAGRIALRICETLEYIHSRGVVHRDLKPENVMIDGADNVKLIDFGIASKAGARRLTFGNFSKKTGTPDYVSPEQVKGKRGDAHSDIYSMGVMLYEMLTGEVPFSNPDPFVVLNSKLRYDPTPLQEFDPEISLALQEIVRRAMEREPNNRYDNAGAFSNDLKHQDQVLVTVRTESNIHNSRKSNGVSRERRVLMYSMLAMIPVFLLVVLLFVVRNG